MRLGNNNLNENEAQWCDKFAKNLLTQASIDCKTNLNKVCTEEDVRGLLGYLWSKSNTVISNDDIPSEEDIEEVDDDEF